jgi:hypothetical protein
MTIYEYVSFLTILWIAIMAIIMFMDVIEFGVKRYVYSEKEFWNPSRYTMQVERNYEIFKKAISELVGSPNLSAEEADKNYLYIKARLYNINPDDYKNNIDAMEREIINIETEERKLVESMRKPYYSKGN